MDAQRESFLKDEYLFLQNTYEDFDRRILTIKSWAVTLSLGAFAAGFQYKMLPLWALGSASAVLFWLVEATWKSFQYTLAARITEIEKYFAGEIKHEVFPLQAYRSWFKEWNRVNTLARVWRTLAFSSFTFPIPRFSRAAFSSFACIYSFGHSGVGERRPRSAGTSKRTGKLKANNGRLLNEMEELTKRTIIVKSDPALHQEQFDIN